MNQIHIGFLIFPGVIQLDVMGAYQVLAFPTNTHLHLVWKSLTPITSNEGVTLIPTTTMIDCPPLDIIYVPGGGLEQIDVMNDSGILEFLRQKSEHAHYIASVCTGSMILAVAGLLKGYKATCHWAFREQLEMLGVEVMHERVVVDRNRITGAGVTSGIDLGLTVLGLLCGDNIAKITQLMMEYRPEPPYDSGSPETTEKEIMESFLELGKPMIEAFSNYTNSIE